MSNADRLQPLLLIGSILLGLAVARVAPDVAHSLDFIVSIGVIGLIYIAMLGLELHKVTGAFAERRFLTVAVVVNFVINPLLAWGLADLFLSGHPELRVGLILFLVTPCIGWYLLFTELAGGDVGLGVSLLGVNLTLQVLLLPLYLWWFAGSSVAIDLAGIVGSVAAYLVAPAAGAWATSWALRRTSTDVNDVRSTIDKVHLKTMMLALVIIAMFASQADALLDNPRVVLELVPPMLAFFGLAFVVALAVGHLADLPYDQTALLTFTATSRNSEASLAIAATAFASPLVALTVVIGPVIELPLLVLMVRALQSRRTSAAHTTPKPQSTTTTEGISR